MPDNPYVPSDTDDSLRCNLIVRTPIPTADAARRLFVIGLLGGGFLGSIGYLIVIGIAETLFVPPLKSPPNYGQFGIIVMGMAFYMSVFGMALSVVPYVTWIGYIPIHLIGLLLIWTADQQFFSAVDWWEAPIFAMLLLLALPTIFAAAAHFWYRKRAINSNVK